jgi:hypothetical protein
MSQFRFLLFFSMLLQRTQTLSEERGQQLRDQRPPVGGYPQRHGHDATQADHQGREAQEKGMNTLTLFPYYIVSKNVHSIFKILSVTFFVFFNSV